MRELLAVLLLGACIVGCPNGEDPEEPVAPPAEVWKPAPSGAPDEAADGRLTCLGKNAPSTVTGNAIELTGYARLLADPDAEHEVPSASVEVFTADDISLATAFSDPVKSGRASVNVPISDAGFTGYAKVVLDGYLDYRFQTSRAVTDTALTAWVWLTTADEVSTHADALGLAVDAGKGLLFGAVHDCDGFGVQYAVIRVENSAADVLYIEGFAPVADRTWTSDTGRFVVPNLPPGTVTVKAFGRSAAGEPLSLLSQIDVEIQADAISAVNLEPRVAEK